MERASWNRFRASLENGEWSIIDRESLIGKKLNFKPFAGLAEENGPWNSCIDDGFVQAAGARQQCGSYHPRRSGKADRRIIIDPFRNKPKFIAEYQRIHFMDAFATNYAKCCGN
jgi:hypothetical protein